MWTYASVFGRSVGLSELLTVPLPADQLEDGMRGGWFGNAGMWGGNAQKFGYAVDSTPTVGSIAWYASGTVSQYGHVALVAAVNGEGTVTVEEYNFRVSYGYDTRTIPASQPSGYIHIAA